MERMWNRPKPRWRNDKGRFSVLLARCQVNQHVMDSPQDCDDFCFGDPGELLNNSPVTGEMKHMNTHVLSS